MPFLARKSIPRLIADAERHGGLKRSLGWVGITSFGVGGTIGAGIFVLTGTIAADYAGPAVALCFVLASIACVLAGLCYAELAALIPVTGSAYSYAYAGLGEGIAWITGWNLMLEWLFSGSLVAIGWSGYFTASLADLGWHLPPALTQPPLDFPDGHHMVVTGGVLNVPAILVTLFCGMIVLLGIRISAWVNNVIVVAKILAVLAVIAFCLPLIHPARWHPFIPQAFGWTGVLHGGAVAFFAYLGFDGVSTLAQEARDPQRTMPIGLAASLGICAALYVAMSLVITGLVDYRELHVADPIYLVLDHAGPGLQWLKAPVGLSVMLGLFSVLLVCILAQVRIFYGMAKDGLIPPAFARIHPRWHTPHFGTIVTTAVAAVAAGFLPLGLLGELISIGTLLAFATSCAAVPILRRTMPDLPRPFRTPFVPWVPLAGIAACFGLMLGLPRDTWIRLVVWLGLGMVVYLAYGARHSALAVEPIRDESVKNG